MSLRMYGSSARSRADRNLVAVELQPGLQAERFLGRQNHDVVFADGVFRFDLDPERISFRLRRSGGRGTQGHPGGCSESPSHHQLARVRIVILDQPRRAVRVDLLEQFAIADMNLPLLQHDRHRHHQRELRRLALVVVHQADDGLVVVMRDHDLRRVIDQRLVGLADVEAAERARVTRPAENQRRQHQRDENRDSLQRTWPPPFWVHSNLRAGQIASHSGTHGAAINKAQMSPLVR